MEAVLITGIFSIVCALIAAVASASVAAKQTSNRMQTQIAVMGTQLESLEKLIEELKHDLKEHNALAEQIARLDTRLETVEREIKELKQK